MLHFNHHLQAVIFDMDGVIVDSEPLHERAFLEIFAEMGYGSTHGVHFPDFYGKSDAALWKDFLSRHQPPRSFEELTSWKQQRFIEILRARKIEDSAAFTNIRARSVTASEIGK